MVVSQSREWAQTRRKRVSMAKLSKSRDSDHCLQRAHAPAAWSWPADLWDVVIGVLPVCSPSRSPLRQALLCKVRDPEAALCLCVPWGLLPRQCLRLKVQVSVHACVT